MSSSYVFIPEIEQGDWFVDQDRQLYIILMTVTAMALMMRPWTLLRKCTGPVVPCPSQT